MSHTTDYDIPDDLVWYQGMLITEDEFIELKEMEYDQ